MGLVADRGTINTLLQNVYTGRLFKPGVKKGALFIPGATQGADHWLGFNNLLGLGEFDAVTAAGYPIGTCAADLTWGNSTMMTRISTLRTNMIAAGLIPNGKVHLVGASMGGLSILNWARANPTLVASLQLLIPCVNVQGIWDGDRNAFKAGISTAWSGGRPPDSANPLTVAEQHAAFPIRLYYSTDDPITTATEQRLFAARSGATLVSMGAIGHIWGAPWSGGAATRFIQANDA